MGSKISVVVVVVGTGQLENVIDLSKEIPKDEITRPIITQLIKAATSVGANYCEV